MKKVKLSGKMYQDVKKMFVKNMVVRMKIPGGCPNYITVSKAQLENTLNLANLVFGSMDTSFDGKVFLIIDRIELS